MTNWEGKACLVTGGGSGIGLAVARALAKEGASVAVLDLNAAAGKPAADEVGGLFVETDVTDPDSMDSAVSQVVDGFGRLDMAHLNAGVMTGETALDRISIEQYRRILGVNVDGVFFGIRSTSRVMTRGGSIVVTASLAGLIAYPTDPVYGLTKHAVVGLVRGLAEQLEERGIRINAVCPGIVDTPLLGSFKEVIEESGFPLLTAEDVARAVVEVATTETTGRMWAVQPGREPVDYQFRGVPGPRVPGAEGMEPPRGPIG